MSKLSGAQRRIYHAHGAAIAAYGLSARAVERVADCSFHAARTVVNHVNSYGPPEEDDIPGATILVIGDAHSGPEHEQSRFTVLGRAIEDRGRQAMDEGIEFVVVCIGDWADMRSLSHHDKGTVFSEGKRYKEDVAAALEAQKLMFSEVSDEVRQYTRWVMTLGNHEDRINRTVARNPNLVGFMSVDDLRFEENGWEVYPFKDVATIHGVSFSHYFPSGVMGRPVSGVNLGRSLVTKTLTSAVQGHSHLYDHYAVSTATGQKLHGLSVGCFFEHDERYAGGVVSSMWWRGLVLMKDVKAGDYELETLSMKSLRRQYA